MSHPTDSSSKLLKILGVTFGIAICIGGTLGVGILRTPGIVAANLGAVWLIMGVWVFGGLHALAGANSVAELATMLPEDGGSYVYIKRAYGSFFGFAGGINDFVLNCCGGAYISITFGEYLAALFPAFTGYENAAGVSLLVLLALINWIGLRAGDMAQKIMSFAKVAAFFVLIIACFTFSTNTIDAPRSEAVNAAPIGIFALLAALAISMQAVMETYAGWNSAVYFTEENRDSAHSIPRALFFSILLVMSIYLLVNAALIYALPHSVMAASKLPAADAAAAIFGSNGGKFITTLALVSIVGILNAMVLYMPRTLFAMSRDGMLPSSLSSVNSGGTPVPAMLATVGLTAAFASSGTFEILLSIAAFLSLVGDTAVNLALFVMRKREPELPRPYRAKFYPIIPGLVLFASASLLVVYVLGNTRYSLYSICIMVLMYPIYRLLVRNN